MPWKNRLTTILAVLSAVVSLLTSFGAQGETSPEDKYVAIYDLIQDGEIFFQSGPAARTLAKYREAEAALREFQREYPNWNPRIVNFRLDCLASRIASLAGTNTTAALPATAATVAVLQPASTRQAAVPSGISAEHKAVDKQVPAAQAERPRREAKTAEGSVAVAPAVDAAFVFKASGASMAPQKQMAPGDGKISSAAQKDMAAPSRLIASKLDADLARLGRAKRTSPLKADDRYLPGRTTAKRGQATGTSTRAATGQPKGEMELRPPLQQLADDQLLAEDASRQNYWLLAGVLSMSVVFLAVVGWLVMRLQSNPLLPARIKNSDTGGTATSCSPGTENLFIPAPIGGQIEPHRQLTHATLRAALFPYLADLIGTRLVQKLISQRAALLDTQQTAAMEVADLEERLEKIRAPLQERLRAYEKRITELERELTAKSEENHTLTQAKISMVRKQLETQRGKTITQRN